MGQKTLWHTYAAQGEHSINKQRGAKSIGPPHHVVEEMILVEESEVVILVEEIGAEDHSHQAVVRGDVGPHGRLHCIESGVHNLGGEKRPEVLGSIFLIGRRR